MIPNQWYAILEASEVAQGKPVGVTRLGEKLAVWRDAKGEVACLADVCCHRGAALSKGQILGDHLECPFHGFQYDASGRCQLIPANGSLAPVPKPFRVKSYPTREAHGFIWIWWGEPREELPPVPFFADLDDTFQYATFRDHWNVHYSRAIENQLDVVHLPFVHKNTIGRGHRTVVDGPLVEADGDTITVWTYNRVDDGTVARKVTDLPAPTRPAYLRFHFPNIWQLQITDAMRIMVAFAPIDEENTLLYVRNYQKSLRLPVLGRLVTMAGRIGSAVIVRQDKRVVITQVPKKTDLNMKEKLVPGDRSVLLYRARRRELIEAATKMQAI
ncbi:MAG: aromatic ring-hydroxylating dioxygenase subunit alpha [Chloroflexota bacterium]